jgi:DNA adenine methylase
MNYPDALRNTIQRLRGIVIENRDAVDCMKHHDSEDTLHYADPPYVFSTRTDDKHDYAHEMSDDDHCTLASALKELNGMVVLSGYRCALYDELYADWHRIDWAARADGQAKRIESLWMSKNIVKQGFDF